MECSGTSDISKCYRTSVSPQTWNGQQKIFFKNGWGVTSEKRVLILIFIKMKIWIIADLHEDIIRTKEAIDLLKNNNCEKIICLWDLIWVAVPYYWYMKSRNWSEVIKMIKENCDLVLVWNHDLYSIKKIPQSWKFKYPKNWYSLDYQTRSSLANWDLWLMEENELSPMVSNEEKEYISNLPEYKIVEYDDIKILFSHWIYPDFTWTTKFKAENLENYNELFDFMKKNDCKINVAWHSHKKRFFSEKWLFDIGFDLKFKVEENIWWFVVPCVANWIEPNWVAIFDTKNLEMEFLPLNTKPHIVPERAKL